MLPLQDPVQRVAGGDQRHPVGGGDQLFDQRIDDRAFDADTVAAALLIGGGAGALIAKMTAPRA